MLARYRSVWLTVWGSILTLGMCVGFLTLTLPAAITLFVVGVVTAGIGSAAAFHHGDGGPEPEAGAVRGVVVHALLGGVGLVALAGVGAAAGPVLALLLLLAALTSPWTVGFVVGHLKPPHRQGTRDGGLSLVDSGPVPDPVVPLLSAVETLSDRELCWAWRDSFAALMDASTVAARERVVLLRHAYLDEFERRHPAATSAWLATEPRAASSPDKFLLPPSEGHRDAS